MMSHLTGVNFTHMAMVMTIGPLASAYPFIVLIRAEDAYLLAHGFT
jgi:hypothetical protein